MRFRRWLPGRSSSDTRAGRRPSPRRRAVAFQSLEERRLLAVLSNGSNVGQVLLEVNEQGAFGTSPTLSVNNAIVPAGNAVGDALYTPDSSTGPVNAVYESGIAIQPFSPGAAGSIE